MKIKSVSFGETERDLVVEFVDDSTKELSVNRISKARSAKWAMEHLATLDRLPTVKEYRELWTKWHRYYELATDSYAQYDRVLDKYVESRLGGYRLDCVTPSVVCEFAASLLDEGLAPTTVRNIIRWLSAFLGIAVDWLYIDRNPCSAIEWPNLPPVPSNRKKWEYPKRVSENAEVADVCYEDCETCDFCDPSSTPECEPDPPDDGEVSPAHQELIERALAEGTSKAS